MMKRILILISLIFTINLTANVQYDHVLTTASSLSIAVNNVDKKFEDALLLEETILKNFNPSGVKVLKRTINGSDFELLIEKSIFGFVKRFLIVGNVNIERKSSGCQPTENAYEAFFDFSKSGPDVTDAVAAFGLTICTIKLNETALNIKTNNALYYRGKKYGMITEPIAKSVLNDQVAAFFNSVKTTINSL